MAEETAFNHCSLVGEIVSQGVWVSNSDPAIHILEINNSVNEWQKPGFLLLLWRLQIRR